MVYQMCKICGQALGGRIQVMDDQEGPSIQGAVERLGMMPVVRVVPGGGVIGGLHPYPA